VAERASTRAGHESIPALVAGVDRDDMKTA
jgi:hypothetical protein